MTDRESLGARPRTGSAVGADGSVAPVDGSPAAAFVAWASAGAAAGAVAGFVWGGIGGRIAMRVVFLTSSEHLRGVTSDDGFEIGTISGATVFLLLFATILGAVGGAVVGVLRMVTPGPTWVVASGTAFASAAYVGASIVHPDGVDFRLLEPLWLTVALFVAIPGLWGGSVVVASDRLLRLVGGVPPQVHRRRWGLIGWSALLALTVLGVRNLVTDLAQLS